MIKEYKIKRYKDSVVGISLGKGTQWSLMRNNPVDYVLDGYQFVNRDFIQEEHIIQDDIMLCKILPLKQKEEKLPFASPELLDSNQALFSFFAENDILISVGLHRSDVIYVGKVTKIDSTSMCLNTYGTQLQPTGNMIIPYSKVRYVEIHSDYLDSLELLLSKEK